MNKYDLKVNPSTVNPIATQPVQTNQERVIRSEHELFLIRFGFTMILVVAILILAKAWKVVRAKNVPFNCFPELPCRNCHFFTNNHYLRCTVRPSCVLTEQALNCSDYRPLNKNQF
jgi:hypothetical protein